jgi:hypothetical protein
MKYNLARLLPVNVSTYAGCSRTNLTSSACKNNAWSLTFSSNCRKQFAWCTQTQMKLCRSWRPLTFQFHFRSDKASLISKKKKKTARARSHTHTRTHAHTHTHTCCYSQYATCSTIYCSVATADLQTNNLQWQPVANCHVTTQLIDSRPTETLKTTGQLTLAFTISGFSVTTVDHTYERTYILRVLILLLEQYTMNCDKPNTKYST